VNAVDEVDLSDIKFYPNPTSNRSTLSFNKQVDFKKITVTDLAGRVQAVPVAKTSTQLDFDCSKLANGVYLIQVETNLGKVIKRLEKL
jgi:hypothetical protein